MDLSTINLSRTIPLTQIVRAQYSPGKIGLPVQRGHYLYSSFNHVYGVPSPADNVGYTISKLRALDNLIERLQSSGMKIPGIESMAGHEMTPAQVDIMINLAATNLHKAAAQNPGTGYAAVGVETGLVVNMTV